MIAPPDANLMVIDTSLIKDGRTVVKIRLKKDCLEEDLIDYIRYIMRAKFSKEKQLEFELLVIKTYVDVIDLLLL